jgi:hypothetical protein
VYAFAYAQEAIKIQQEAKAMREKEAVMEAAKRKPSDSVRAYT